METRQTTLLAKGLSRLIRYSRSQDPYEAMTEWDTDGRVYTEEDDEFTEQCELCGALGFAAHGLTQNIIIENRYTGHRFRVGVICASRFTRMEGAMDEKDSRLVIETKIRARAIRQMREEALPDVRRLAEELLAMDMADTSSALAKARALAIRARPWFGERWELSGDGEMERIFAADALGDADPVQMAVLRWHLRRGIQSVAAAAPSKAARERNMTEREAALAWMPKARRKARLVVGRSGVYRVG